MKKKLLSTLAAVSMLTSLVTPVLAAEPSHHGEGHYSYATGSEGLVTEAAFLKDSYTRTNGTSKNFIDELMAWVDDDTLAHELRYVEWYIENHDSNYPFSLDTSVETNKGRVYCGFDSGSATLTAVITRNDGSLVTASTKLVAAAKSIQYATGFYFEDTTRTFYTGSHSITGGTYGDNTPGDFNTITIKPTPSDGIFSQAQYDRIEDTIMNHNGLDVTFRTDDSDVNAYTVQPYAVGKENATGFNGYTGYSEIYVYYPVTNSNSVAVPDAGDAAIAGKVTFEIYDDGNTAATSGFTVGGVAIDDSNNPSTLAWTGSNFFDNLLYSLDASTQYSAREVVNTSAYKQKSGSRFLEITINNGDYLTTDLLDEIGRAITGNKTGKITPSDFLAEGTGSFGHGTKSGFVSYPVSYTDYTLSVSGNTSSAADYLNYMINSDNSYGDDSNGDLIFGLQDTNSNWQYLVGRDYSNAKTTNNIAKTPRPAEEMETKPTTENTSTLSDLATFLEANSYNQDLGFYFDGQSGYEDYTDITLRVYDKDSSVGTSQNLTSVNGYSFFINDWTDLINDSLFGTNFDTSGLGTTTGVTTWYDDDGKSTTVEETTAVGASYSSLGGSNGVSNRRIGWFMDNDPDNSGVTGETGLRRLTFSNNATWYGVTLNNQGGTTWADPYEYTPATGTNVPSTVGGSLQGYAQPYGTAYYDYELLVTDFQRYQGTQPTSDLDDVARSIRINSNVAVQPSSLHQTSAITVAVGDTIDLESHFKITSTANVWWDLNYNEAYFNSDSSYAYNDYGVILDGDDEVLGVRTGKNKIVADVYNSATGATHTAEVVVTVVPRTGVTTTVTPTSTPLAVTPSTQSLVLGGGGVQLTASYYGESTYDVNDNTLPTLQSSTNGDIVDIVAFESLAPTVVTVSDSGFVTAVGVGTGTVKTYIPNSTHEAIATFTVTAPVVPTPEAGTTDGTTGSLNTPVPSTGVNALGQLF